MSKRIVIIGSRDIQTEERDFLILLTYHAILMGYRVDSGLAPGSDDASYLGAVTACNAILSNEKTAKHLGMEGLDRDQVMDRIMRGYLPWRGFEGHYPASNHIQDIGDKSSELREKAYGMVRKHHKMFTSLEWGNISGTSPVLHGHVDDARKWENFIKKARNINKLMTRNCFEVLGDDLDSLPDMIISCAFGSKFDDDGKLADCSGGTGMAVRLGHELGVTQYNIRVPRHTDEIGAMVTEWSGHLKCIIPTNT
ncbi:hypothetical protein NVP1031O_048 [Vibrio phage 1.031.O._10N.261.46.F8]|nr:hypothetical protein NVP1031O_048 [Vibrio phage 1.031.O._10N.261.46.F8]